MNVDVRLIKEIEGLENRHIYSVEKEIQAFIFSKNGKINRVIYYKLYGIEGIYEKEYFRKVHDLKILPIYFNAIVDGSKTFEVCKNDRNFQVGDELYLREFIDGKYTGNYVIKVVTYALEDKEYLNNGYIILGLGDKLKESIRSYEKES